MAAFKDYYQILGVGRQATQPEVKSAFRKLAAKHHPDRNPDDPAAEDRFKEINEAYTVLSDQEKRGFYDRYGSADGPPPYAGGGRVYSNIDPDQVAGFSDFFQTLFGFGGVEGGTVRGGDPFAGYQSRQALQSAEASLEIDLVAAYHGGERTITVGPRRIDVSIPKGARSGTKLRLRGQAPGGGDLILKLVLAAHPTFMLDRDNVRVRIQVPDFKAVLGGSVLVPTLDGEVEMTLPKATQSGRILRLCGQGWPKKEGGRGDELAEVLVVIPEALSDEQLELYRRLEEANEPQGKAAAA